MTLRVLVSGQSNSLGISPGGPNWSLLSPNIRVWDNVNPYTSVGSQWVTPEVARAGGTFWMHTTRNNFAVWFCDKLARATFETVDLTIVGREGRGIEYWSEERPQNDSLLHQLTNVYAATGQGPADIFLMHQGEANSGEDPALYRPPFLRLLSSLKSRNIIDENTIVIVGGLAHENQNYVRFTERALHSLTKLGIAFASSHGLPTTDGVHFTGQALFKLGAVRYFSAYQFAKLRKAA
jgi:hypothetical protein